jgi:hypothetical protein
LVLVIGLISAASSPESDTENASNKEASENKESTSTAVETNDSSSDNGPEKREIDDDEDQDELSEGAASSRVRRSFPYYGQLPQNIGELVYIDLN